MKNQQGTKKIITLAGILTLTALTMIVYLPEQLLAKPLYRISPKIPANTAFPVLNDPSKPTEQADKAGTTPETSVTPLETEPTKDTTKLSEKEDLKTESVQKALVKIDLADPIKVTPLTAANKVQEAGEDKTNVTKQAKAITSKINRPENATATAEKALSVKAFGGVSAEDTPLGNKESKSVEIASANPTTLADPVKLYREANTIAQKGQYKEAALLYQQALKINPKLADAYVGMAATFGAFKKWDRAILLLQDALKNKAHFMDQFNLKHAHYNLAVAYCMAGQLDNAWNEYETTRSMKHPYRKHLKKIMKTSCPQS